MCKLFTVLVFVAFGWMVMTNGSHEVAESNSTVMPVANEVEACECTQLGDMESCECETLEGIQEMLEADLEIRELGIKGLTAEQEANVVCLEYEEQAEGYKEMLETVEDEETRRGIIEGIVELEDIMFSFCQ